MTQGDPARAQTLCDRMKAPFPCLADPNREGFRTYGLRRGSAWQVIGPAAIARGLQARRKGHRVEKIEGDAFQMPGTFIIDVAGTVRYARYARHSGDHPDPRDLVQGLREL